MESNEKDQEWFESPEPEVDFNELNRIANVPRYANAANNNIDTSDIKPKRIYEKAKQEYDGDKNGYTNICSKDGLSGVSTKITEGFYDEENPVYKFIRIKKEIDMIERDLKFYSDNVIHIKIISKILERRIKGRLNF
jgi:hypothetical protein